MDRVRQLAAETQLRAGFSTDDALIECFESNGIFRKRWPGDFESWPISLRGGRFLVLWRFPKHDIACGGDFEAQALATPLFEPLQHPGLGTGGEQDLSIARAHGDVRNEIGYVWCNNGDDLLRQFFIAHDLLGDN